MRVGPASDNLSVQTIGRGLSMLRNLAIGAAILVGIGGIAQAKESGQLVLFSKGHFEGASRSFDGPTQKLELFTVRSVQVPPGEAWELCNGNTFSGCRRITASDPSTAFSVRSVRPAGPAALAAATAAAVAAGVPVSGVAPQVLRGVASEFFVTPEEGGIRVEVPAAGGDPAGRADSFCRSHGWRSAAHEDVQNVSGRNFLADVLCVAKD